MSHLGKLNGTALANEHASWPDGSGGNSFDAVLQPIDCLSGFIYDAVWLAAL